MLIIGIVIIIVIICLIINRARLAHYYEDYLVGFWVASREFSKEAEVDEMFMYIGPQQKSGPDHMSYLLMSVSGETIFNEFIRAQITTPRVTVGPVPAPFKFEIKLAPENTGTRLPFPDKLSGILDIGLGRLQLYADGRLYAQFYKDHLVTENVVADFEKN